METFTVKYSDEDAAADAILLTNELIDFDLNWVGVELLPTMLSNQKSIQNESITLKAVSSHLQNLRFLKFSKEALEEEILQHKEGLVINVHGEPARKEILPPCLPSPVAQSDLPFTISLPHRISVSSISGIERMLQRHESTESRERQLKKDVERDRILLNGVRISGSEVGLEGLIKRFGEICDHVLKECSIPALDDSTKAEFSRIVLSKASRTHSGGITFQALQSFIDPSQSMLLPQSNITPPIRVKLFVGKFPLLEGNKFESGKWGLVCSIVCESVFEVQQHLTLQSESDDPETSPSRKNIVKSVYEDYVMIEASVSKSSSSTSPFLSNLFKRNLICSGRVYGSDIDGGTVSLSEITIN